jgi:transcription elongation factor Elf1
MSEADEMRNGTYKCPVCGHRDATRLARDKESLLIPCSYCETLLEVTARGPDSIRFQAQVAEEASP